MVNPLALQSGKHTNFAGPGCDSAHPSSSPPSTMNHQLSTLFPPHHQQIHGEQDGDRDGPGLQDSEQTGDIINDKRFLTHDQQLTTQD